MRIRPNFAATRPRPRLATSRPQPAFYRPKWRGAFEGYARNFVARNFWRVRHVMLSEEDALQECACIFARCVKTYRVTVTEPRHFMALYKTAIARDFHTHALADVK